MILLDPVNAITSIRFYRKVAKQDLGRSALFLGMLSLVFAATTCLAVKVRVSPMIRGTFSWLETSMPRLVLENGALTSDSSGPVEVRHPEIKDLAIIIDTTRTAPVTSEELKKAEVAAFLTRTALYLESRPGTVEPLDFSKGAYRPGQVVIDAGFYRRAASVVERILYPVAGATAILIFLFWKSVSTLFYAVVGLALNAVAGAGLQFGPLLNIALYAQSLVIAVQLIFLFMPRQIPGFGLLAPLVTGLYIWLAIKSVSAPEQEPPAPA